MLLLNDYLKQMKTEEYSYEAHMNNGVLEIAVNSFGSHEIITIDHSFFALP